MCRSDRVLDPFELDDVGQDTPCLGVAAVRASPDGSTTSGTEAQSCDWTVPELFGLHPVPEQSAPNYDRLARLDDLGLIWLLRGRPIVELTSTEAVICCPSGATLKFYRRTKPAQAGIGYLTQIVKPAPQIADDAAEIAKGATA